VKTVLRKLPQKEQSNWHLTIIFASHYITKAANTVMRAAHFRQLIQPQCGKEFHHTFIYVQLPVSHFLEIPKVQPLHRNELFIIVLAVSFKGWIPLVLKVGYLYVWALRNMRQNSTQCIWCSPCWREQLDLSAQPEWCQKLLLLLVRPSKEMHGVHQSAARQCTSRVLNQHILQNSI